MTSNRAARSASLVFLAARTASLVRFSDSTGTVTVAVRLFAAARVSTIYLVRTYEENACAGHFWVVSHDTDNCAVGRGL